MGTFRNFRVKHLFIGVLAATGLSISGADAATVLWDFSVGAGGNQGTTLTQGFRSVRHSDCRLRFHRNHRNSH